MVKDVDKIRRILVAPYPNSAFMMLQRCDLLSACDTLKDERQLISNLTKFYKKVYPTILKMFPQYTPDNLFGAIQIVPDFNYKERLIYLRNTVMLAIGMVEELNFNINDNMDLSNEEFAEMILLKITNRRNELKARFDKFNPANFSVKGSVMSPIAPASVNGQEIRWSPAFIDYCCEKCEIKRNNPALLYFLLKTRVEQYDSIINAGLDGADSIGKALSELSAVVPWEIFEPVNVNKLELAMANRFMIDLAHHEESIANKIDKDDDLHDVVSITGPEYIDFLRKFVNDYNRKVKENPKYGFSIRTFDPRTRKEVTLTHQLLAAKASQILTSYPDALDMGDPLQYDISYDEIKIIREQIIAKAKEDKNRKIEEERARIEKEKVAREKEEAQKIQLAKDEERIDAEINEQAVLRNEKIDELLEKINMLKQATEKHLDKYKVDKEELEIWQTLLIEEKRTKAREAAVQIVKIGGKLFTPSEAQELQLDSRNTEHDVAEKNKDKEALERLDELARRQEFYYNNLGIVAVIKFDDMDIYVSSSGCLYTEPANQSGVGHNAVYVLHYTNARQLFSRKIVKQEVRSERNCNEGSGIKYFPHIDGWEERLIDHNNKSAARNTDPEGVVQFINDMQNELVTNNQKMKVFGCGNASNTRTTK